MDTKNIFRKNLVKRRKALGMTQEMLAQRMNVSPQAVSKWENSSYPDTELLPQLARALDTSLDALFGLRTTDAQIDVMQLIHDRLQAASPEKRPDEIMQIVYTIICAYQPSFHNAAHLKEAYDQETYAGVKSNEGAMLARLNEDLRYFFFMENPKDGVNHYLTNRQNIVRLLHTLADEDAIQIISYLGAGMRNRMHDVTVIANRLKIPVEKVQYVIDRLDRFGLVWRVGVDLEQGETIMYGYTHNQALAMILTLAQSICNYFQHWDPSFDEYNHGLFKDENGFQTKEFPQVSWWGENEI